MLTLGRIAGPPWGCPQKTHRLESRWAVWLGVLLVHHPNTYVLGVDSAGFDFPLMHRGEIKQSSSLVMGGTRIESPTSILSMVRE